MAVCTRCDGPVRDEAETCEWCGDTMILTHRNSRMCNSCGDLLPKRATACPMCGPLDRGFDVDEDDEDADEESEDDEDDEDGSEFEDSGEV